MTDPRHAKIRFLFRGEGHSFLSPVPDDLSVFSATAQDVYTFMRSEGAVFISDLCDALDLTEKDVEPALIALVLGGLVTNDQLDVMRLMVSQGQQRQPPQPPQSSFEKALADRRSEMGLETRTATRRPGRAQYRSAKQRVRQRLVQQEKTTTKWPGRWAPVHRFGVLGKPIAIAECTERQTRQVLARYGVVTYASLEDEEGTWEWPLINRHLQRMEMRGEVRRGYFVKGLPGVQYALPDVVEKLRSLRDLPGGMGQMVVMNAADPANLYGPQRDDSPTMADGQPLAFSRVASTYLVQYRGVPLVVAANLGGALTTLQGADPGLIQQAVNALFEHLSTFERLLKIELWNGQPVLESDGPPLLEAVGCYRAFPGMEWAKPYR